MTSVLVKARSELVLPANFPLGGVVDVSFMFHSAVPASNIPALSPTRGSCGPPVVIGAVVDMLAVVPVFLAQEASAAMPTTAAKPSRAVARRECMRVQRGAIEGSSEGAGWVGNGKREIT